MSLVGLPQNKRNANLLGPGFLHQPMLHFRSGHLPAAEPSHTQSLAKLAARIFLAHTVETAKQEAVLACCQFRSCRRASSFPLHDRNPLHIDLGERLLDQHLHFRVGVSCGDVGVLGS